MDGLPLLGGLQKPEVQKAKASWRRQPQDTPKGVLLPVHSVLGKEKAFRAVHRHHYHPPRRELFPGQQGQREDRADDAHRRTRLKVAVTAFATEPYHSYDHWSKSYPGPSEGVDGTSPKVWSPRMLYCRGRSCASFLRWTILIA